MTDVAPFIEQAKVFVSENLSSGVVDQPMLMACLFVLAGVGLSVFGAKLSKPAITMLMGLVGAYAGYLFSQQASLPAVVCVIVGGAMVAVIARLTFRLWVGVVAGLVLSSVALGTFSYRSVIPHVTSFQDTLVAESGQFSLPSPEEQDAYRSRTPKQWAEQFWSYLRTQDADIGRRGTVFGAGAAMLGLFLGVVAMRWMLILSTSIMGTVFVTAGLCALLSSAMPSAYQSLQSRPTMLSAGMGGFLVASLFLQMMLTREAKSSDEKKKEK